MIFLGIATLLLLFRLAAVARRRKTSDVPFILVGCLAVPLAVIGCAIYDTVLISILGYSWQKDATIRAVGGLFSILVAILCHVVWLSKRAERRN